MFQSGFQLGRGSSAKWLWVLCPFFAACYVSGSREEPMVDARISSLTFCSLLLTGLLGQAFVAQSWASAVLELSPMYGLLTLTLQLLRTLWARWLVASWGRFPLLPKEDILCYSTVWYLEHFWGRFFGRIPVWRQQLIRSDWDILKRVCQLLSLYSGLEEP